MRMNGVERPKAPARLFSGGLLFVVTLDHSDDGTLELQVYRSHRDVVRHLIPEPVLGGLVVDVCAVWRIEVPDGLALLPEHEIDLDCGGEAIRSEPPVVLAVPQSPGG
jgi:hypothetical protein